MSAGKWLERDLSIEFHCVSKSHCVSKLDRVAASVALVLEEWEEIRGAPELQTVSKDNVIEAYFNLCPPL